MWSFNETEDKVVDNLSNLERFWEENKADINYCYNKVYLELKDVCVFWLWLIIKVNVVTTCEEAFFAENSNKLVFDEIDKAAKENGVTVTGGGYQDIFWGNLIIH